MNEFKKSFKMPNIEEMKLPNIEKIKLPKIGEVKGVGPVYFKAGIEKLGLDKVNIDGIKTTLPKFDKYIIKKGIDKAKEVGTKNFDKIIINDGPMRIPMTRKMLLEKLRESKGDLGENIPIITRHLSVKDIKPISNELKNKIGDLVKFNKVEVKVKGCPKDGTIGKWIGERGKSELTIDRNKVPGNPRFNPDGKTFGELLDKYGAKNRIKFKDGEPDFSEIAKVKVKIKNFTDNRYKKGGNFDQARDLAAKKLGMTNKELEKWMSENKYTFHEVGDCKTMLLVPNEIHGNIRHSGGVSKYKNKVA